MVWAVKGSAGCDVAWISDPSKSVLPRGFTRVTNVLPPCGRGNFVTTIFELEQLDAIRFFTQEHTDPT